MKNMRAILRLLAWLLIVAGLAGIYIGYAYNLPNANLKRGFPSIKTFDDIAREMRGLPYDLRNSLHISSSGLIYSFGGGGVVLLVMGGILMLSSRKPTVYRSYESAVPESKIKFEPSPADSLLEEVEPAAGDDTFNDIRKIIALSHASLGESQSRQVFRVLKPELVPYQNMFTPDVADRMAKQILDHYIVNYRRSEAGMTPDQFRVQDEKMNELARETLCRRYLPPSAENVNAAERAIIGKVYTLTAQSRIQQETLTQSENWRDISLRNAVDILSMPAPDTSSIPLNKTSA